jgi:glycosyltransferase involved in cell wall biosynthesis
MHILYYHQYFSTPQGATGTRSYEMARRLISKKHRVTMICGSSDMGHTGLSGPFINGQRKGMVEGIDVVEFHLPYSNKDSFFKRSMTFFRFALKSIVWALKHPYDLVFATSTPLTAGIPGIVATMLRRKPFVFEVRDLWPELPHKMGVITNPWVLFAMKILEWLSYHSAKTCIGLSPGIVQGIKKQGIASERITMVPNGCDIQSIGTIKSNALYKKKFTAIFAGAHGIANGLDAVLDAAAVLKKMGRDDICLKFIGDGRLKPALQKRAVDEKLDNCEFHDPIPKTQMIQELKQADIGLMILANVPAFYYGTSPNKFFDYIACGLPVINNYPGWLADLINENHCGCAIPPDDPDAFARALIALVDHPVRLQKMRHNSRKLAETQFDRDILANHWIEWIEKTYASI